MIKKLDEKLSLKIAAGEVIERPSSLAKELIENSIDADAKKISLTIEQGGKVSFVIEDDGSGISFDELPLAVERYATSKISNIDDLEHIATLGYRGEALASIASVSRMEIRSRTENEDTGGIICCEGGQITVHRKLPCSKGTRIQIEDLFFNVPARRKFLKSASAELRRIIQITNDYALIHPEITFTLTSDGRKISEQFSTDSIDSRLNDRWGATRVLRAEARNEEIVCRIWWNSLPDSRRTNITTFVNNRRIQDGTVKAAIMAGDAVSYGEWLVVINMPADSVDVNIHPAKHEVRFRHSQSVFKTVYDAAKAVFAEKYSPASAGFAPIGITENKSAASASGDCGLDVQSYIPAFQNRLLNFNKTADNKSYDLRTCEPAVVVYPQNEPAPAQHFAETEYTNTSPKFCDYIGQSGATGYLVFDFAEGIAMVDPHAAHERILYEEISKKFKNNVAVQTLSIPETLPSALVADCELCKERLKELGFEFSDGQITGVPMLVGHGRLSPVDMLRSAIKGIESETDPLKQNREVWWRLARLACKSAVKLGHHIEREEAEAMIQKLMNCAMPYTCPHGRPTMYIIEREKLTKVFER